jgi:crotonobetainyl-CoA:carnitine CoA-transferase CaiB-like acyl-CoA transferase
MDSEGMATDFIKSINWNTLDYTKITQRFADQIAEPTRKFMLAHTKAEIYKGGVESHSLVYPINDISDTIQDIQLKERGFFVEINHPELNTSIIYPSAFALTSNVSPSISCRAPLIGEHNQEVYEKELKISKENLLKLKQARII